ncbi:MAG: hypothetical protein U0R19_04610 [Bryobacteraceae bacterium]
MGPQPARQRVSIEELYPKLGELRSLIIGDPDSDEHRLAYAAAWREVDGLDPERAELIERQIAMGQLTPLGRDWLLVANRCQDLLLRKREVWAPRWQNGSRMSDPLFLRGFVECMTVGLELMRNRAFSEWLFRTAPVRHLNLVGCTSEDQFIAFLANLPSEVGERLLSLHLDGQSLGNRAMVALVEKSCWRRLQWLSLAYNEIGKAGVKSLANASQSGGTLERLVHVNLSGNPIDPVDRVFEDQGVPVHVSTPEVQKKFPDAVWMHAPIVDGRLETIVRFQLRSRASGMVAGAAN